MKNIKLCLICSSGGHLMQLELLKPFWEKYDRFWVSEDKIDVNSCLKNEKLYYGYFPTTRNFINAINNLFLAIKLIRKEKPDVLISNGAGIAVPFFLVAKALGIKTVYIEVIDRIFDPTLTGRIINTFCDVFIVQWKEQEDFYSNTLYLGTIL